MFDLTDNNWIEAFAYAGEPSSNGAPDIRRAVPTDTTTSLAPFKIEDILFITAASEGAHDEYPWLALGKLKDNRWFFLSAGCDYTGWDCQASGITTVAPNYIDLVKYGVMKSELDRLAESLYNHATRYR